MHDRDDIGGRHDGGGPSGRRGHRVAVLEEIVAHKRLEVEGAKRVVSESELRSRVREMDKPRNFFAAVTRAGKGKTAVIAEVKRMSPSAGLIRPEYAAGEFSPEVVAERYYSAGAAAISCLTDEKFFGGHLSYIERIRKVVPLPVLRKDFVIDSYQIYEARAAGADAVLLIAECLDESQIVDMLILTQELGLTSLLEVHSLDNLLRIRPYVGFPHRSYALIGINNRDLSSMKVDITHTLRLAELVEDRTVLVSESGIQTPEDLRRLRSEGVQIVLVGEHLMREADQGAALKDLLSEQW